MDDLLKAQEKMASGPVRAKEDVTAETLDNTDILPYVTEELPDSTVTALKEEKAVEEKAVEAYTHYGGNYTAEIKCFP